MICENTLQQRHGKTFIQFIRISFNLEIITSYLTSKVLDSWAEIVFHFYPPTTLKFFQVYSKVFIIHYIYCLTLEEVYAAHVLIMCYYLFLKKPNVVNEPKIIEFLQNSFHLKRKQHFLISKFIVLRIENVLFNFLMIW